MGIFREWLLGYQRYDINWETFCANFFHSQYNYGLRLTGLIGFRLALLEVKIIIICMLQKYRFIRCAETEVPLKMAQIFNERPANGVYVQVEKR